MRQLFIILTVFLTATAVTVHGQTSDYDVSLGDSFDKWKDKFMLKGISSQSGNKYYQYNKTISNTAYDHKVDKLFITINNNKVIAYTLVLLPNTGDIGVPQSMIDKFKKESGFDLQYNNGSYSMKIPGKIAVSINRKNTPDFGGDRITIYTTSDTD